MGKVLKINLSHRSTGEYTWTDKDRELYLGGKIMAAKILYDNIKKGMDPLSSDNIIVITTGPLTGTGAPSSSRFNISTLSPLTGLIASSNCGGDFGIFLKKAGYDGLYLEGKCEKPTWIEIDEDRIQFHDAGNLWGKTTGETQEILGGKTGKIVIGPAGENLIRYASIFSGERAAGRAGVGAVMGFKNLKAITATGKNIVNVYNREKTKEIYKGWVRTIKEHPLTGRQLPKLGTAGLLSIMNAQKTLATKNYSAGRYKDFEKVSGEYMAEKYLIKNKGCTTCPIQCGRLVEVDGKQVKGPELETLGLLGPNIENNNLELILKWNYLMDEMGMDTISAGNTIAFAMELNMKGMWDNGLEFGKTDNLSGVIYDIAYRRGIGDLLAEGTKRLAQKFGGSEFAMNSKGLELPAYEPRGAVGQGLGYATANRGGCHINGGYLVFLEGLGLRMDPYTHKSKAALAVLFQDMFEAISAGGNCIFTSYTVIPGILVEKPNSRISRVTNRVLKYSGGVVNIVNRLPGKFMPINMPLFPHIKAIGAATGMKMNFGRFRDIGERGYNMERLTNMRLGLTEKDDSLPGRLVNELQDPSNPKSKVPLNKMKSQYYKIRGWDKNGTPKMGKLKSLNLVP
jgi:Aldehyde:ferredoxin oxidoreductase